MLLFVNFLQTIVGQTVPQLNPPGPIFTCEDLSVMSLTSVMNVSDCKTMKSEEKTLVHQVEKNKFFTTKPKIFQPL